MAAAAGFAQSIQILQQHVTNEFYPTSALLNVARNYFAAMSEQDKQNHQLDVAWYK
jgi:hypothetical protein